MIPSDTDLLELPAGQGYISWNDIKSIYEKFASYLEKKGVEYFYEYNIVSMQWMLKESRQIQTMNLMGMNLQTATAGDNEVENKVPKTKKSSIKVYFTDTKVLSQNSILRDTPKDKENITIKEFIEKYPNLAKSFDGKDADSRLDYFYTRHNKTSDEGDPIYIPKGKQISFFRELIEEDN